MRQIFVRGARPWPAWILINAQGHKRTRRTVEKYRVDLSRDSEGRDIATKFLPYRQLVMVVRQCRKVRVCGRKWCAANRRAGSQKRQAPSMAHATRVHYKVKAWAYFQSDCRQAIDDFRGRDQHSLKIVAGNAMNAPAFSSRNRMATILQGRFNG